MSETDEMDDRLCEIKAAVEIREITDWPFNAHSHIEHMTDDYFHPDHWPAHKTWPEEVRAIANGYKVWPFMADKGED